MGKLPLASLSQAQAFVVYQLGRIAGFSIEFQITRRGVQTTREARQLACNQIRICRFAHANNHIDGFADQVNLAWREVEFKADAWIPSSEFSNERCQVNVGEIHRQ
ncbi:hypothetical protein D3C84_827540 [compost metagenome]